MKLREHQERCINDCLRHIKTSIEPAVVDASVSFGKSVVIGELAQRIVELSQKKVLVLCPNGTLVDQNAKKLRLFGYPHSIFSASLKQRSVRNPIIVGTPITVKNSISRFGKDIAAILVDEGDGITASIQNIISTIREHNPNVRVIGFTGTPWRTKTGWIARINVDGNPFPESECVDPYYTKIIHRSSMKEMMDLGYLTPVVVGDINAERYETSSLVVQPNGRFLSRDVDRAYHGMGRKTAAIIQDIVAQSQGKNGVLIFCATLQHCREAMESLPPELTRMVASGLDTNEATISAFRRQEFKYLVNKDMLTVGADFHHVDVVAVLRKTESSRLLTQIVGRGLRLHEDNPPAPEDTPEGRKYAISQGPKPYCLYLDYTEDNITTHYEDGDVLEPKVKSAIGGGSSNGVLSVSCPTCGVINEFSARRNDEGYGVNADGNFIDLDGNEIECEHGPIPAHHGRRCYGMTLNSTGTMDRCNHRWTSKECGSCGADNDISARYCRSCKEELVDPNKVLQIEYRRLRRDPYVKQTEIVEECTWKDTVTTRGTEATRVDIKTPHRSFSIWVSKDPRSPKQQYVVDLWDRLRGEKPATVTYQKNGNFYDVFSFWNEPEVEPEYREIR